MELYGVTADAYMIGDCFEVGNIHICNHGAFSVVKNCNATAEETFDFVSVLRSTAQIFASAQRCLLGKKQKPTRSKKPPSSSNAYG